MIGIQGSDAILSFFKNDYIPFVCSTDISIAITANKIAVRAPGDGTWKKYTYQTAEYTVTLSGLMQFDDANFTGWDMLENQLGFIQIPFRCSFTDDEDNVKTIQGTAMIETSTLSFNPGTLVKGEFNLTGSGKLIMFDGLEPCPSEVLTVTVTGQTASDGIVHVTYTYSGVIYQVKYKVDDTGDWVYVIADLTIDIPGLAIGDHFIMIVPVCFNGFEGVECQGRFSVTQALTCSTVISTITINGGMTTAIAVYTGAATQMKYRIDGGAWVNSLITATISLVRQSVGAHTIEMVPICANGVSGTGFVQAFTVSSQPAQSKISWTFDNGEPTFITIFAVLVNGVAQVLENSTSSGFIFAPVGASVKAVLTSVPPVPHGSTNGTVQINDTTLSTQIFLQNQSGSIAINHTFTANGDDFLISELVGH